VSETYSDISLKRFVQKTKKVEDVKR